MFNIDAGSGEFIAGSNMFACSEGGSCGWRVFLHMTASISRSPPFAKLSENPGGWCKAHVYVYVLSPVHVSSEVYPIAEQTIC